MENNLTMGISKGKKTVIYYADNNGDISMKECTKCFKMKGVSEFTRSKGKLADRSSICKDCEYLYRQATREIKKATEQVYREENRVRIREVSKIYWSENKARAREHDRNYYERNRDKVRKRQRNYYLNNKNVFNTKAMNYRAKKESLTSDLSVTYLNEVISYFNNSCALSGESSYEIDHVVPISTGTVGTTKGNLIPLSQKLNRSKKDKNIFEWFESNKNRFEIDDSKFLDLINWLALENNMTPEQYKDFVFTCHKNKGVS